MVSNNSTSCSYGSISNYNYNIVTKMKNKKEKFDAQQQAYDIADDHYEYLNATYGAKYKDAIRAAEVSIEKIIEALHGLKLTKKVEKSIDQWREVLKSIREL
jgi:hypothetical protein